MANDSHDVKPGPLPPERTGATGPGVYAKWRATTPGTVTETLEQRNILGLVGSVDCDRRRLHLRFPRNLFHFTDRATRLLLAQDARRFGAADKS